MEIVKSIVYTSMQNTNNLECSYSVVIKETAEKQRGVLIIWKDLEIAIFDYFDLKRQYLLLKHYNELEYAKKDFFKLIGKMCKKSITQPEKYFLKHKDEDNRIVFIDFLNEIAFEQYTNNKRELNTRKNQFLKFVKQNIFTKSLI